ncbi:hypothetical protein MetexDRAFT_0948 [Methylorubrum extorquens DSM 13060]|uniref:Lipoprotein n=1 Tax=Methylorubrum extorquens DSM 13060 TaxID=882800 RepID=H1KE86_METEX|nr:hypothetical protein MetexDRAFT_0948 [Methylorubrum extorquens DSM 13060]
MRLGIAAILAGISLALPGCTYTANTTAAPARNVITSFSNKVPGKWAVLVEADRLNTTARSEDLNCSAHTFPINFTQGFPASVRETFPNVFAQVEDAEAAEGVRNAKARGVIQVRGENLQSRLKIVPGFWSNNVVVDVDMTVAVTVEGANGRLFGKTFDGRGRADRPLGMFCAGGAEAVKAAAEDAQRDVLRRIAEELANSERVRSGRAG